MPGVVRKPDNDSMGHPNATASPDTITNNQQTARFSDMRTCSGTDMGSHTVIVNNLDIQVIGDPTSNGHTQVQGSDNVRADG